MSRPASSFIVKNLYGVWRSRTAHNFTKWKPNITLDMEGVLSEKLRSLKNTQRGHLANVTANVTANVNGALELLSDDKNLQEVREKLTAAEEAFLKFKDAHLNNAAEIGSEENEIECDASISHVKRESSEISTGRLATGLLEWKLIS